MSPSVLYEDLFISWLASVLVKIMSERWTETEPGIKECCLRFPTALFVLFIDLALPSDGWAESEVPPSPQPHPALELGLEDYSHRYR